MKSRDEHLFTNGLLVGAALMAHEQRQEIDGLDERLRKVEREHSRPQLRAVGRLVPVGWRHGQRVYQIVRHR